MNDNHKKEVEKLYENYYRDERQKREDFEYKIQKHLDSNETSELVSEHVEQFKKSNEIVFKDYFYYKKILDGLDSDVEFEREKSLSFAEIDGFKKKNKKNWNENLYKEWLEIKMNFQYCNNFIPELHETYENFEEINEQYKREMSVLEQKEYDRKYLEKNGITWQEAHSKRETFEFFIKVFIGCILFLGFLAVQNR